MYSGYDHTNPRLPTRKSKPSLSISTVCGRLIAIRRTSSASTTPTTVAHRSGHPDNARTSTDGTAAPYASGTPLGCPCRGVGGPSRAEWRWHQISPLPSEPRQYRVYCSHARRVINRPHVRASLKQCFAHCGVVDALDRQGRRKVDGRIEHRAPPSVLDFQRRTPTQQVMHDVRHAVWRGPVERRHLVPVL